MAELNATQLQQKTETMQKESQAFQLAMMNLQTANSQNQITVQTTMGMNDGNKEVARKLAESASR